MTSVCRSLAITLPEPPGDPLGGPPELTPWLHSLTESMLPRLLRQADPQHVIEYSLALITVLNEVSSGAGAFALSCWVLAQSSTFDWSLEFLQRACPWLPTDKVPNLLEMASPLSRGLSAFTDGPFLGPSPVSDSPCLASSCAPEPQEGP